jgi:hypothetical protein
VLFALGIFAITSGANEQSQDARGKTAHPSSSAKQGLNFSVGSRGLDSLSFNGQSLLRSAQSGEMQPWKSVFRSALDALLTRSPSPAAEPNKQSDTIDLSYLWGHVSCAYGKQDEANYARSGFEYGQGKHR